MAAFVLADVDVEDMEAYKASGYLDTVPEIAAKFGGKYRARGGETLSYEGTWVPKRMVIIEFPDMEKLKAFWESEEYAPWRKVRHQHADSHIVAIDGVD